MDETRAATIAGNLRLLRELRQVLAAFQGHGVQALILKGAALQATVYSVDERPMQDVDLLVTPASLDDATAALATCGLAPKSAANRPLGVRLYHSRGFAHSSGVQVDLHTALAATGRWRVDTQGLFERALPCPVDDALGLRLGNEDLLLHLAVNLAKDDLVGASRAAEDVARVVAGLPLDWSLIVGRARSWGCSAALWLLLQAAVTRNDAPLPSKVLAALRPGRVRRRWLHAVVDPTAEPMPRWSVGGRRLRQLALVPVLSDRPLDALQATARFGAIRLADTLLGLRS